MCDDFDIKTLPSNFEPVSRPSVVITKLNEKRKKAHEDAIDRMKEKQLKLNLEVDEEIMGESEIFNKKLRDLKDDVDSFIRTVKFEYRKLHQSLLYGEDIVREPFLRVSASNEILLKTVDDFHEVLINIEKKRSDKLKLILNETCSKVSAAAYKLPYQAEELFCDQILELNKITLNNFQNFAELKKELKLQVSQYMKLWTEELLELKEKQIFYIKKFSKKSVSRLRSDLRNELSTVCQSDEMKDAVEKFETTKSDLQWPKEDQIDIPVSQEDVEEWLRNVQKTLASLDLTARNLVSLYKSIIIIVFNRFFSELAELKEAMVKTGIVDKDDIEDYQSEIYTPTVEELNIKYESDFENLESIWEENINKMKDSVQTTYVFLKGAAVLWDRHFKRVIDLQTCVLLDLENTVGKNSQSSMVHEADLNIRIEKLRQGSDEKKLLHSLADVRGLLDKIENLYNVFSDMETQVVQKYKNMMEIEIEVLMAEIQRFLTVHPPDADRDPKIQRKRASQCSEKEIDARELLVPNQILYCTFQVDATKNWMFGLWESINHYLATGRAEILAGTEHWMERQREKINDRLQVKLAFHRPRYFRIKCSIYDKRLKELLRHADRVESHKKAAELEITTLKTNELAVEQEFSRMFDQFVSETNGMLKKVGKFEKSHQVRGILQTLRPLLTFHENCLAEHQQEYSEKCMDLLDVLRVSGYQFLKSTKLFSEEGTFSIEEITSLQKNISKLDEYSEKTLQKMINDVKIKFTKYQGYLENTYTKTLATLEELIREMEHNENVVKKIKALKESIRNEVISVRTTMKKIETDTKDLIQKSTKNVGSTENVLSFMEKHKELMERMQHFVTFMGQPDPTPKIVVSTVTSLSGHASRLQSKSHVDQDTFLSTSQLDKEPNTFISKLNVLLNESYVDIKKQSKEFYAKHHPLLLDQYKIQPTHDRCMDEVHHKYKSFQLQSEGCWFELLNEFSVISLEFQNAKNRYLKEFRSTFRRSGIRKCEDAGGEILRQLEDVEAQTKRCFLGMFERLRTLHGHPNNKLLLEQLQEEFVDLQRSFLNIEDILIPHKEKLWTVYNEVLESSERVQEALCVLEEDNRLATLIQDLKYRLADDPNVSCHFLGSGSEDNWDFPSPASTMAPTSTINYYSPSESSSSSESGEFLEELERTYETQLRNVENFVHVRLPKYLEERKEIWEGEIGRVRDLFKVKYDY